MKDSLKEKMKLVIILLFFVAAYLAYEKFSEPRIPELDSDTVSFSKNVVFGTTINAASEEVEKGKSFTIDLVNAKKEIDIASDLGSGLARFDMERRTLESADELGKLDEAVSYARAKKMKIYFAYLGRESWLGSGEGAGGASWEDFKSGYKTDVTFIMGRYKPDYILILPECPYGIGRQVDSKRSLEEWFNFAKELGLSIKQISFPTQVALEGVMVRRAAGSSDMDFAELVLSNSDAAINMFSMDATNAAELVEGMDNLLNMKKKYHWDGAIWMGDVQALSGDDAERQKNFLLYSLHLANSNGFSGIVLGQLRDGSGKSNGILAENYSIKPSYTAIKEVMADRR